MGPADTVVEAVHDAADVALGVVGAVVGVAIAARGVEMIAGTAAEGDGESSDEED